MASLTYYNIFVNFDHPDGSTSWGYICYYILVKFDSPDGSTCCGLRYYNILVNLTFEMAAQVQHFIRPNP